MWYLMLGSAGVASTLYALWRAAKAEVRAAKAEAMAKLAESAKVLAEKNSLAWQESFLNYENTVKDQLARREAEIDLLVNQRKEAIDALEKSSCPGALRDALRLSLGIK